MIKVLFFDFDGTILDSKEVALKTFSKTLKEYNYNINHKKISRLLGDKMKDILEGLKVKKEDIKKVYKEFYKNLEKIRKQEKAKPCSNLNPLYELSKKYPMIIVSNSKTSNIKKGLRELKIEKLFKNVYGADKFPTKDIIIKKLVKKQKIKFREAVFVGDRYSDIRYAKKAGVISVAISNKCSWSSKEELKAENPDYIIWDFEELKRLIEKLKKIPQNPSN